jgi:hypothetical protein
MVVSGQYTRGTFISYEIVTDNNNVLHIRIPTNIINLINDKLAGIKCASFYEVYEQLREYYYNPYDEDKQKYNEITYSYFKYGQEESFSDIWIVIDGLILNLKTLVNEEDTNALWVAAIYLVSKNIKNKISLLGKSLNGLSQDELKQISKLSDTEKIE